MLFPIATRGIYGAYGPNPTLWGLLVIPDIFSIGSPNYVQRKGEARDLRRCAVKYFLGNEDRLKALGALEYGARQVNRNFNNSLSNGKPISIHAPCMEIQPPFAAVETTISRTRPYRSEGGCLSLFATTH